jgi:hypothetical protein
MTKRAGLFPTFFLSGFECSTFRWKDQGRRDLAAETDHYRQARADHAQLRHLGIGVAREGIPWPVVDQDGAGSGNSTASPNSTTTPSATRSSSRT